LKERFLSQSRKVQMESHFLFLLRTELTTHFPHEDMKKVPSFYLLLNFAHKQGKGEL
jgi:hypothetical protein